LNVIEEGTYEIPELTRLKPKSTGSRRRTARAYEFRVRDYFGDVVTVADGRITCMEFPFVVMTSNAEREFPAPFLRRCVRLNVHQPTDDQLANIVTSQLGKYEDNDRRVRREALLKEFARKLEKNQDLATDQLLNAMFLTVSLVDGTRSFDEGELERLRDTLLQSLVAN
jgi:MoxR-like ATPase